MQLSSLNSESSLIRSTAVRINVKIIFNMAKNGPRGKGRAGGIKNRSQVLSPRNKRWTKVNNKSGKFIDQMSRKGKAFKSVKMK